MKLNLRKKIILFSLIINLIIAVSIGGALYKYAGELFYKSFLESKESLARSIANSIDGDKHKTFTTLDATKDSEYKKYLKYLNSIKINEDYISYLFTINYDRKNDKLTYIVDSDIMTTDTIWITTEFFGFALSIGKDDEINIKYNESIFTKDFNVIIDGEKFILKISENGTLYLGDKELIKIVSRSPLVMERDGKKLSITNRELYSEIYIRNKPIELYCSFTAKGESQSMPGELYAESKDIIQRCKTIIDGQKTTIVKRDAQTSIYGINTSTVYGIIKDGKGFANGLVVIELFQGEITNFKKSIAIISMIVSLMTFVFTIILTVLLAEYIINPIKKLTHGTRTVGEGNLDSQINLKRNDEFGVLADSFNSMVTNLKGAYIENKQANDDLTAFKNNLEKIVEERTSELESERYLLSEKNKIIENDIYLARTIQQGLIPRHSHVNFISSFYKPMTQVGGDFYDFIKFRDSNKIGIFISDVSGHGISAAFITSMIKTTILQSGNRKENPAELLTYINEVLYEQTAGNFITAFYGIYDSEKKSLHYANAGHPQPYIITDKEITQLPKGGNTALAIYTNSFLAEKNKSYLNFDVILPSDSKLFLFTDGFTEACPVNSGIMFEDESMLDVFIKNKKHSSQLFVDNLFKSLIAFRGDDTFEDDVCLICLDIE